MQRQLNEHIELVNQINVEQIIQLAALIKERLSNGNKVIIFGNGGSAADAQHFAAELIGRFVKERKALPAIALTTDTSIITAIANDYSFDDIYFRQLEGLLQNGDIVIGISTSGNSKNVIKAIEFANTVKDVETIVLTGKGPNKLVTLAKHIISINSTIVARIQEIHILILHLLAEKIEE